MPTSWKLLPELKTEPGTKACFESLWWWIARCNSSLFMCGLYGRQRKWEPAQVTRDPQVFIQRYVLHWLRTLTVFSCTSPLISGYIGLDVVECTHVVIQKATTHQCKGHKRSKHELDLWAVKWVVCRPRPHCLQAFVLYSSIWIRLVKSVCTWNILCFFLSCPLVFDKQHRAAARRKRLLTQMSINHFPLSLREGSSQ